MSSRNEQGGMDVKQKNVFQKPLHQHSNPRTATRDLPPNLHAGYCSSTSPIAATITSSFIEFASSRGTDLRKAGIASGDRYCIDAALFKEAIGSGNKEKVPGVKLESTHAEALKDVSLDELNNWAANQDARKGVEWTRDHKGSFVRESGEIGGKEPRA